MQHKLFEDAIADFSKAMALDPKKENKWASRAKLLKEQIEHIKAQIAPKEEKPAKDKKKKGKK